MAFDRFNPNEQSYMGKLVLRWIALIIATLALVATAYSWSISLYLIPGVVLSWLWHLLNVAKRMSSQYPVHPGANVALDLILYIVLMSLAAYSSIGMMACFGIVTAAKRGVNFGDNNSKMSDSEMDTLYRQSIAGLIGLGLASLLCLFHFILFIWACIDTHRLRRSRRETMLRLSNKA